jgi:hypothetical protein
VQELLSFYKANLELIEMMKDIIYFFGAWKFIEYLCNRQFEIKGREIQSNLKARGDIEAKLAEYVLEKYRNKVDVGIRFVF